jgi:outer membrane protein TolC
LGVAHRRLRAEHHAADLPGRAAHRQSRFDQGRAAGSRILSTGAPCSTWQEVDNALTAYAAEQHRRDELERAVAQNRQAITLAHELYTRGLADFLRVLTAEQQLLATEQQEATSTTTIASNLVALYKALGGGWETSFPRPERAAAP